MDLERSPPASPAEAAGGAACSICLDPVLAGGGGRSVAKLQCGHEFHLGQIPSRPCRAAVFARPDLPGMAAMIAELNTIFLLDCIGSAFNAKGAMQCPNCRKIEKGRWLYASGQRPSADIDLGGWAASDNYDIAADLVSAHLRVNIGLGHTGTRPFGFQWCPFSGFTQLASVFEEREAEPTSCKH
nr:unnamed protein product [Digitaria exilis]